MKREIAKFLSGFLVGAGVVQANIGFCIATGLGWHSPRLSAGQSHRERSRT